MNEALIADSGRSLKALEVIFLVGGVLIDDEEFVSEWIRRLCWELLRDSASFAYCQDET